MRASDQTGQCAVADDWRQSNRQPRPRSQLVQENDRWSFDSSRFADITRSAWLLYWRFITFHTTRNSASSLAIHHVGSCMSDTGTDGDFQKGSSETDPLLMIVGSDHRRLNIGWAARKI